MDGWKTKCTFDVDDVGIYFIATRTNGIIKEGKEKSVVQDRSWKIDKILKIWMMPECPVLYGKISPLYKPMDIEMKTEWIGWVMAHTLL